MSLSQVDRAALTQMLETQPDLDRWRLRAQTVEEPESGSDLALDDKIFPHMAISELARMSLVLAGEHLRLALDDQKDWLSDRKAGVTAVRTGSADLNLTDIIRVSAEDTFASAGHHDAVRRLWREMSADAHVLGWSLFQRSSFGPPDRRTGIGQGQASGSPGHVAEAFLASYRMLKHGWSLFDRRCEQPTGA